MSISLIELNEFPFRLGTPEMRAMREQSGRNGTEQPHTLSGEGNASFRKGSRRSPAAGYLGLFVSFSPLLSTFAANILMAAMEVMEVGN